MLRPYPSVAILRAATIFSPRNRFAVLLFHFWPRVRVGSFRLSPFPAVNQRMETAMQSIKDTYQRQHHGYHCRAA